MKVGLIGGGRMGEALVKGFLQAKVVTPDSLGVSDVDKKRVDHLKSAYGVVTFKNNAQLVQWAQVIILAVKPQTVAEVCRGLGKSLEKSLVVSIVAGLSIDDLKSSVGDGVRVVRVMPNTPAQVMEGMSMLCFEASVGEKDRVFVRKLFESVGRVSVVQDEKLMNVATALVGSGPAFVFVMIEALADGAVRMGLPREDAYAAAAQMTAGAARMVLQTGAHPAQLKDQVTSPGGTTAEGLKVLEKNGVRGVLIEAIEVATRKSEQLGAVKGK